MHLKIRDSLLFSTRNQEKHKLRNKLHNIKFNIENVNKNSKIFGLLSKENYSQISEILKEMSLCKLLLYVHLIKNAIWRNQYQ